MGTGRGARRVVGGVLVVDDDEDIRSVVALALSRKGYEVLTAARGSAALDLARQFPPDVILLDMRMPLMDGRAFAATYRHTAGPHAPIIVFTAASQGARQVAEIGADGYLAKPFTVHQLYGVVDKHTRRS